MGQKHCSIKDEDELAQIIGKYRMTSELHWVEFRAGIDNQMKQTIVKKDSYSSDSLEDFCEESTSPDIDKSKTSSDDNFEIDMNNDKSLSQSSSDISSVHDNTSITSHFSFEIVEETEALQTEDITESVDIRISPRNSTVMSFDCPNNFYSEFSLVANVEVQLPDSNENLVNTETDLNYTDIPKGEDQSVTNGSLPEIESMDINANESIQLESSDGIQLEVEPIVDNPSKEKEKSREACKPPAEKFYANKIEITKQEKRISSSVEKKIAEEIKEMKEREEEIRKMREKLAKEMSQKVVNISDAPVTITPEKNTNCDEKPMTNKTPPAKVENAYIQACVFAIKRKVQNENCAIIQQESPVEREIRIAREREEELKREREQALKCKLAMDSELSATETDVDSALSICSDSSFDSVSKLTSLFPRTLSPEISNSNGISLYSSSAGSICSLESLSQRERQNAGSQPVLSVSPDLTYCKPGFPFTSPRVSSDKKNKSIDMERFISSKGKEIKFKGDSGHNIGLSSTYYEIRPPQVKKGEEMTCKRFVTAAAKIQNELKEMQEREEQFKKERANLKDIKNVENLVENGTPVDDAISPVTKMESPNSVDDLEKNNNKKQDNSANSARRRSVLIDEWEQRIQKSILQP